MSAYVRLVTDSGSADNAITALSNASLQIGQPPISKPATPITLTAAIGSHMLNQTSAAASATKPMRSASGHRKACPRALVWYIGVVQKMTTGPQENSEIKVERVVEALQGGRKPELHPDRGRAG